MNIPVDGSLVFQIENDRFIPSELINEGGFGSVWELKVQRKKAGDTHSLAIKFALEPDALTSEIKTHQYFETQLQRIGGKVSQQIRIPKLIQQGVVQIDGKDVQYFIMEKFGKDLSSIKNLYFTNELSRIYAILHAGLSILKGLYVMHLYMKLVHGDIKPQNFLFQDSDFTTDKLVFIDLGLTRPIRKDNVLTSGINGTRSFASIHVQKKYLPTPRCDIESLCYMLLHFIDHQLPWNKKLKEKFPKVTKKRSDSDIALEKIKKEKFVLMEKRALKQRIQESRFASQGELILADLLYAVYHMPTVPESKTYKALCKHFYYTLRHLQSISSNSSSSSSTSSKSERVSVKKGTSVRSSPSNQSPRS